jgi:drug/metabolite transporter (DMT)-like permease
VRPTTKAYCLIHGAVLAWGFTSVLGRLITLQAFALVWWRLCFSVLALAAVPRVWRGVWGLHPRRAAAHAGVGALLGAHFVAFYEAVKLGNASVAATCLAVAPALVALLDPLLRGHRPDTRELLLGCALAPGVALVVGGVPTAMHAGIVVGVSAAAIVALVAVLNKRLVGEADPLTVTWLQLGGGLALLTLLTTALGGTWVSLHLPSPGPRDAVLLAILALPCTVLPTAAYFAALRHLSAFGIQLTINLEPVYAVVLAIPLLGEQRQLGPRFYLGMLILLGAVFGHALLSTRRRDGSVASTGR